MYALELKNLKKIYDNGFEALKGINLQVKEGDFFALLGVNGAGKSTTIGLISHLLEKSTGEIIINGFNLSTKTQKAKLSLGVVPQEFNLPVFETCEEILLNVAGYYGIHRKHALIRARWLLNQLGLENKRNEIVYRLSGGMKRRLMIARSLIHEPKLLLLDEPSAGVDVEIRQNIWSFLKSINEAGTTIILTTHYLEEAEQLCKNLAIIHHGQIVEQTSMKKILDTHTKQTYVLNTKNPLPNHFRLMNAQVSILNTNCFELTISSQETLNIIFPELLSQNIQVKDIHHKTNRLEALFMELIKNEH